jgi:hypothetical protein
MLEPFVSWQTSTGTFTADQCIPTIGRAITATGTCDSGTTGVRWYAPRAMVLTEIRGSIHNGSMLTTEACDLDVLVNGPVVGDKVIEIGAAACNTAGENCAGTVEIPLAQGDGLELQLRAPTTNYGPDGAACACTGASAGLYFSAFGTN